MMRWGGVLLVCGVLGRVSGAVAVRGPAATAGSHRSVICPPRHEQVIMADVQAVVFQAPQGSEGPTSILACAYGAERSYDLGLAPYGSSSGSGGVFAAVLAGAVVAYATEESTQLPLPMGRSVAEIWVRNLRNGRLSRPGFRGGRFGWFLF